ncbi:2'-5' RNA ligase family protein [Natronorarus salvus]|uniref:2'-5' RNA ligase family protein n=1 Tax=Natronorarus salvus TaxID=3117733 RepID=UPI002F262458
MYSLNVPLPGRVEALCERLRPELYGAARVREQRTLVLKRFGGRSPSEYARLERGVRNALAGTEPFEARIAGLDAFTEPVWGEGPVVYLGVESPELIDLHDRLLEVADERPTEGERYVPHVTLARGGDLDPDRLRDLAVDPITWTVRELEFWDATYEETIGRLRLSG